MDGKLKVFWKLSAAQKLKRGTKVEEVLLSFTLEQKFHLGSESVSVLGHLCSVIIFTPHLRLELSMCTFDKYIWEKYTLQKYSWEKYTYLYLIWDWSSECARLGCDDGAHLRPLLAEVSRPDQCNAANAFHRGEKEGLEEEMVKPAGLESGRTGYAKVEEEEGGHHRVQRHQCSPHRYHRLCPDSNFPLGFLQPLLSPMKISQPGHPFICRPSLLVMLGGVGGQELQIQPHQFRSVALILSPRNKLGDLCEVTPEIWQN